MSDFKPGEVVNITIKGVRIAPTDRALPNDPRDLVTIADEHGDLWPLPPQAAVVRVAPAEWPPQVDDLWRDNLGIVWFTTGDRYGNPMLINSKNTPRDPNSVNQDHGPLTLVRSEAADVEDRCNGEYCFHPDCSCKAAD